MLLLHLQFVGKTFESYAPIGPYLVPQSEAFDPNSCSLGCLLNGESVQKSSTKVSVHHLRLCISSGFDCFVVYECMDAPLSFFVAICVGIHLQHQRVCGVDLNVCDIESG